MADFATNLAFSEDDAQRARFPMADGLLDYFPNALAAVAEVSKIGSEKHNVGQPMHWARGKSTDHRNKIMRHLADAGLKDGAGVRHSAYVAWRALALLQEELERDEGAPMSRGSQLPDPVMPELREADGWQPHDTAPRDGTTIEVEYHPWGDKALGLKVHPVRWARGRWEPPGGEPGVRYFHGRWRLAV